MHKIIVPIIVPIKTPIILKLDKETFSVLDLPGNYCVSNFKDSYGNDLIEFDVSYFNSIVDLTAKE